MMMMMMMVMMKVVEILVIMAGAADLDGALDDLVVVGAVEGELAAEQQEHDHAHRPQVRLLAVAQLHQHLSREGAGAQ